MRKNLASAVGIDGRHSRARLGLAALLPLILPLISADLALADRHCLPAQDAYFFARRSLQSEEIKCDAALLAARGNLAAAVVQAEICGCGVLTDATKMLLEVLESRELSCAEKTSELLASDAAIQAVVFECHG